MERREFTKVMGAVVDVQFAVPGATGCPFQFPFDLNTVINHNMKLPSPAGRNSASINGMTTPLIFMLSGAPHATAGAWKRRHATSCATP